MSREQYVGNILGGKESFGIHIKKKIIH